jgi:hypothetical protein
MIDEILDARSLTGEAAGIDGKTLVRRFSPAHDS